MIRTIAAMTAAALLSVLVPAVPADAATQRSPSIFVIGGKTTLRTTNVPGSPAEGWWSMLATHYGSASRVTRSAESGSGALQRGLACQGTTFGERLKYLEPVDIVIVELGGHDTRRCTSSHRSVAASPHQSSVAIRRYLDQLAARVDQLHIPRSHVVVISPYGAGSRTTRATAVRSYVRRDATSRSIGFRYVAMRQLRTSHTIDDAGVIPNRAGHVDIARKLRPAIDAIRLARTDPAARTSTGTGPSLAIVGDSITSTYSDEPGSPSQGWWSLVGRSLHARSIRTLAEGASGMIAKGNSCEGSSFTPRLPYLRKVDLLIVEGGRNDYKKCTSNGHYERLTTAQSTAGINQFAARLAARVEALGMDPSQVFLVTPWGPADADRRVAIQTIVRRAAAREGFTYVETPPLKESQTFDSTHPNRASQQVVSAAVQAAVTSSDVGP